MARSKFLMTVVFILVASLSLTSCENVRKKFVRKKKKADTEDVNFIPVLEPEEYPVPEKVPLEIYKQHYSLIKAWYKDIENTVIARYPSGNPGYALKQIFEHIDEMQKLLVAQVQPQFEKLRGYLKFYADNVKNPTVMRNNMARLQSDLRAFDRQLRTLSPSKIKKNLVAAVPTEAADSK